jgi:hypothetical protein
MRFHEGDFAYDIEQLRDPQTRLFSAWRFTIYKLRPVEAVITRGQADTRELAEAQARTIISNLQRSTEGAA